MKNNNDISIKIIEDNDLCISCGACTHICPFDNIIMSYVNNRGKYDAIVQNEDVCLNCNGLKNCLYVCPSYHTNYSFLAQSSDNDFLGKIEQVYNGYAENNTTRKNSSSGGFIRSLSKELLEKKQIDGIISISQDEGLDYSPKIIKNINEMPNSIYHNINYENALNLLKENNGKFLLIGLPCQITSIEKLMSKRKYKNLSNKIYAKVALICGYTFDRTNMEFFAEAITMEMKDITYRENGRYRKTRISNNKNSILFDVYNPKTVMERVNNSIMFDKWMPQKNCLYCVDHIGYCADIVVGDAWQKRYNEDKIGTNIIIARTEKGKKIVDNLSSVYLEKGYIDEIKESQHIYATPYLGLSMAQENIFKDKFVPNHNVGEVDKEKFVKFSFKDKVKMKYLKAILRKKQYKLLKLIYILVEFKLLVKLVIKKIIGRKV